MKIEADKIYKNFPLKNLNTWKVGGPADQYIEIENIEFLAKKLKEKKWVLPIVVIGMGSNLLIRDAGVKGTVINLSKNLKKLELNQNQIYAEAGVSCSTLARFAARNKKNNCAFMAGIPGSIGGALAMNAGCYGNETWDFVTKVKVVDIEGNLYESQKKEYEISYRNVKSKKSEFFIGAYFEFPNFNSSVDESMEIKNLLQSRKLSQPLNWPTAGSTFKNPKNDYAARLIEDCGLKGHVIGGARVSEKHANFIENIGNATAKDIEMLIALMKNTVKERKNIDLEIEVKFLGEIA
jgi:UDP-N-acetylmuramate dehydrogenase